MARNATEAFEGLENEVGDYGTSSQYAAFNNVTADIVDAAVEEYMSETGDVDTSIRERLVDMLKSHSDSSVAKSYYYSQSSVSSSSYKPLSVRPNLRLPYMLSDSELRLLSEYAPEYMLKYELRDSHDHALAAAGRMIDRQLIYSRVPYGTYFSDVGGSIVPLITSGRLGRDIHTCSPILDVKDPSRRTTNLLRARCLLQETSVSEAVHDSCRMYLDSDVKAICDNRVQDCGFKTDVITSIHVYDIPIEDWAGVMVRKSARVVEGCMIFPRDITTTVFGVCEYVGARYEVDACEDVFKMFFKDSPSMVYQHKLSDYMKYGVDQMLYHDNRAFSYKIVERRGDTIFFRILETAKVGPVFQRPVMRMPDISMVEVKGFNMDSASLGTSKVGLNLFSMITSVNANKTYKFPAKLWDEMMAHSKALIEKNTFTYERLFNFFRSVAPRQSINGVVVAGNYASVDANTILPLVLHVALFSFVAVAKTRIEVRELVDIENERRVKMQENTLMKVVDAFWKTVSLPINVVFFPFSKLADYMENSLSHRYFDILLSWHEEPKYMEISAARLLPIKESVGSRLIDEVFWLERAAHSGPITQLLATAAEPEIAAEVLDIYADYLPQSVKSVLEKSLDDQKPKEESTDADQESVAVSKNAVSNVVEVDINHARKRAETDRRRQSILEAIEECEIEQRNVEVSCMDQYRKLTFKGEPMMSAMSDYFEAYKNPQFWFIENGYVTKSFSNYPLSAFSHSALFVMHSQDATSKVVRIIEEFYKGKSAGKPVSRTHLRLDLNEMYTGWAYGNDDLNVYNGPAIVDSMRQALLKPLDFEIVLKQGPPGCGKTTSIVNMVLASDVVLVPVKMSCLETRGRVKKKGPEFQAIVDDRVRTVDSYLVNLNQSKVADLESDRLLADEAFMIREGRWLAAAAHLGVSIVYAFGDEKQIPHVPRAVCPSNHIKLRVQRTDATFITFRCPAASVACWNHLYENRVRTCSKVAGSVQMVSSGVGMEVPKGCVMMGMYQSDKKRLEELYGSKDVKIMTVHESQGNTYEHVWLHRFDYRKRVDKFSLYDKPDYVLVAMSRNTQTFKYISPDLGDYVSECIKRGQNCRAINLASDVESAGQSVSFD